ncbi:hypothetical protein K1719_014460 [Acacia pycnantha]|nr:hypothetical protein K1719_014460 [Acacia pycnantha]
MTWLDSKSRQVLKPLFLKSQALPIIAAKWNLNLSLKAWVGYLATDSLLPEWKIWSPFLHEITKRLKLYGPAESPSSFQGKIKYICYAISKGMHKLIKTLIVIRMVGLPHLEGERPGSSEQ